MNLALQTATPDIQETHRAAFLRNAMDGLTGRVKSIPPKWLYDATGSALFEQITALPEYYLTRTEVAILRDNAAALARHVPAGGALVELGSGASIKTRLLLDAGHHIGAYVPIDISEGFLHETSADLRQRYPHLAVHPVVGDFALPVTMPDTVQNLPKVGFFPGSTIGNLEPEDAVALLARARAWPGIDTFILGADLVKPQDTLIAAYDDSAGVTARFIANILTRMNTELGATFNLELFAYNAHWNADAARIEMSLMARKAHRVRLNGTTLSFEADEPIHVSQSRKYTHETLAQLARAAGWHVQDVTTDPDHQFAIAVLAKAS